MNNHTIVMMVKWMVTDSENSKVFNELRKLPLHERREDPRVKEIVERQRQKWSQATKIEKLATLGWVSSECEELFCNILDQLIQLKIDYVNEVRQHGKPPELKDEDLEKYETEFRKVKSELKE